MPAFARSGTSGSTNPFILGLESGSFFSPVQSGTSTVAPNITYILSDGVGNNVWSNDGAREAFVGSLAAWAAVANITFEEVLIRQQATWSETLYDNANSSTLGSHYLPNNQRLGGTFNVGHPLHTAANNVAGGVSYVTYLHELGHGLGLSHPFDDTTFPGVTQGDPYDPGDFNFNNGIYTVMGYVDDPFFAVAPGYDYGYAYTPMAFDIAAVQAIYGANMNTATGNDTYLLPTVNASGTGWASIWDAGGYDIISGAAAGASVSIDLRAATLLNQEGGGGYISRQGNIFGGFTIANGVVIEEAIGSAFDDVLIGNGQSSVLRGGAGNDTLHGNGMQDALYGGMGDDLYIVTGEFATIVEDANGGNDTIRSSVSVDIGLHVENVEMVGVTAAFTVNGNSQVNNISAGTTNFAASLYGFAGNDILTGSNGNDIIDGGIGRDTMAGGVGNDIYYIDDSFDVIIELNGQGTDLVYSTLTVTRLQAGLENLTLLAGSSNAYGSGSANILTGNNINNALYGNGGSDSLYGLGGDDRLSGGGGTDSLYGGAGSDTYIINDAFDTVFELTGEGTDIVRSKVDYVLGDFLENLIMLGTALNGTGNDLGNVVRGQSRDNIIYGLDGDDRLYGNQGDDVLIGGAGQDILFGGGNSDTFVFANGDFSGVTAATADRIADFNQNQDDLIDLSGVDAISTGGANDNFTLIGEAAFSGTAGELRYNQTANFTDIYGDTNGDGVADFMLRLNGSLNLQVEDFVGVVVV